MSQSTLRPFRQRQPHIYGAQPLHFRQGVAVASGETPPTWSPEAALDPDYPYTLEEYKRDIQRWCGATKVTPERQGPLVSLAIGGAGRTVVDEIDDALLRFGGNADFGDGRGIVLRAGIEFIFRALEMKFPTDFEALMLRTGLDFFHFTPLKEEQLQSLFLRFDTLLDRTADQSEKNMKK